MPQQFPNKDAILLFKPLSFQSLEGLKGVVVQIREDALVLESAENLPHSLCIQVKWAESVREYSGKLLKKNANYYELLYDSTHKEAHLRFMTELRKSQHIDLCNDKDIEAQDRYTGFEQLSFIPKTLPEISLKDISTKTEFLGQSFSLPLLIAGMTGGTDQGQLINERLAETATRLNIPMGVGSQRIALKDPKNLKGFNLKKKFPKLFLIGNMGIGNLLDKDYIAKAKQTIDMIEADALALHVNVLQELIQVEGDREFSGIIEKINHLCSEISTPIIIKEVGCGVDAETARLLQQSGVAAIDVGGRGGTSFGYIEGLRSSHPETKALGELFRNWGIPTAHSLSLLHKKNREFPLIATGGIRDGVTVAKAVALGASLCGMGLPFLRAAMISSEACYEKACAVQKALTITMVLTGSKTLKDLSKSLCFSSYPYASEFFANDFDLGATVPSSPRPLLPERVSIPGKIMLCGEYSCLFGGKALSFTIDKYLKLTLTSTPKEDTISVVSDYLNTTLIFDKTGELKSPTHVKKSELLQHTIKHLIQDFGFLPCSIEISSELKPSFGFGSSSALRLALLSAYSKAQGNILPPLDIAYKAYELQRSHQGQASGYDILTQIIGGMITMQHTPGTDWPGSFTKEAIDYNLLQKNITIMVGGKGAPSDTLIKDTYPSLKENKVFREISDNLVEEFLKSFRQKNPDIKKLVEKIKEHRAFFMQNKHFPHQLFSELAKLPGFDSEWTAKTTGSGGEDAILLIGEKHKLAPAIHAMQKKNWFSV